MTSIIKGAIQNGERVDVEFGWYKGRAGLQRTARGIEVAYHGPQPPKVPAFGIISGERVEVVRSASSETVDGMAVLTVRPT